MFGWFEKCNLGECVEQLFKFAFGMLSARPKTNWFDINRLGFGWWPKLINGFGGMRGRLVGWTCAIWTKLFFSASSPTVGDCCMPSGSVRKICRCGGAGGIFRRFIDGATMCGRIWGFINGIRGIPLIWLSLSLSLAFEIWLNFGIVRMLKNFGAVCWKILEWKTFFLERNFDENSLEIACIPPRLTRHRWCAVCEKYARDISLKFSSKENSSLNFSIAFA